MTRKEPEVTAVPFAAWSVLPPAPGLCQACAKEHEPEQPHDKGSLFYQYWFRSQEAKAGREERWPTWADAMAHCTPELRRLWREELTKRGVEF